jgi:CRISPR-associated protein Cas1
MDLRTLPKVRDSWSYLYVDHCRIEVDAKAIAILDERGRTPVPCASLSLLLLGPGTAITHSAVRALADNGCLIGWTGEQGVRFYALGVGETRSAKNLYRQIARWANPGMRLDVAKAMYRLRFGEDVFKQDWHDIKQLRGMEGARVRDAYAHASINTGVPWFGRTVHLGKWNASDPINRAISSANSALYGVCHAAIVAAGYSPAVGFIHTGKQLSFVYDIADLYKTEITIPAAFATVAGGTEDLESRVRRACRDAFRETRLLERIVSDIELVLMSSGGSLATDAYAETAATPGGLWDPEEGVVPGGVNYADPERVETIQEGAADETTGEGGE